MMRFLASVLFLQLLTLSSDALKVGQRWSSKLRAANAATLTAQSRRPCSCQQAPCSSPNGQECWPDAASIPIAYIDENRTVEEDAAGTKSTQDDAVQKAGEAEESEGAEELKEIEEAEEVERNQTSGDSNVSGTVTNNLKIIVDGSFVLPKRKLELPSPGQA
mmetsp:Transcript_72415/g.125547  ORF Transcript_72415/g.125547 Transcript_72415/m.125547 type:complete len:162 (+) Transcript_72415:83-568(+)